MREREFIEAMYRVPRGKWSASEYLERMISTDESFQIQKPLMPGKAIIDDMEDTLSFQIRKTGKEVLGILLSRKYFFELKHIAPFSGKTTSFGRYEIPKNSKHFNYVNELYSDCMKRFPKEERLRKEKERQKKQEEEKREEKLLLEKTRFVKDLISRLE